MSKEKEDNPGHPDFVSIELCEAFREAILAKVDGIKTIIVVSVSVSTAFISVVMWLLNMAG